jgi:hypothetical protein
LTLKWTSIFRIAGNIAGNKQCVNRHQSPR